MDRKLHMRIVSPTGMLFEGTVHHAVFPGIEGSFAVYARHAPLISALGPGDIMYSADGGDKKVLVTIAGGFAEVDNDAITVAAEPAAKTK